MKNKRIRYDSGGTVNLHKSFDDLNTSVNYNNSNLNVNLNKKFPKGFSVNANLNKVKGKSSTAYTVQKDLGKGFSMGVTETPNDTIYKVTYKKNFKIL
jgi:hypothetical protein